MQIEEAIKIFNDTRFRGLNWYECGESGEFWTEGVKGIPYEDTEVEFHISETIAVTIAELMLEKKQLEGEIRQREKLIVALQEQTTKFLRQMDRAKEILDE